MTCFRIPILPLEKDLEAELLQEEGRHVDGEANRGEGDGVSDDGRVRKFSLLLGVRRGPPMPPSRIMIREANLIIAICNFSPLFRPQFIVLFVFRFPPDSS